MDFAPNYLISVIVPFYKVENYMERTVRSLFGQSAQEIEYIFVDDCGGDRSLSILEDLLQEYPQRQPHVRIVRNKTNLGSSESRNQGLSVATGQYIAFCDGDDWLDKDGLEEMAGLAVKENYDIIWTDFYFDWPGKERVCKQASDLDPSRCISGLLTERLHGALWNKLYKRSLFEKFKIRFNTGANLWEDLSINIQLFYRAKNVGYLPKPFYHYFQGGESLTRSSSLDGLEHIAVNATYIIDFLKQNAGQQFDDELMILKLASKQTYLFGRDMASLKKWKNIFPESNNSILRFSVLPVHFRILGWCVAKDIWPLPWLWLKAKGLKKRKGDVHPMF